MESIPPVELAKSRAQKNELPWFALHVRTRHETAIGSFLAAKGYEQFVPLYKFKKRWSDRIKVTDAPLFPGYLFCRFDPQFRLPILKTPGVIQIIGYNRIPTPIDETEMDAIQTVIASGLQTQPWPFLAVGERVRIGSGSLRGLDGIVVKMKDNHRLVVSVSLPRRSVAVEIDSTLVEPFSKPAVVGAESQSKYRQDVIGNILVPARLT
jgi:transcription antitermination factor NusG